MPPAYPIVGDKCTGQRPVGRVGPGREELRGSACRKARGIGHNGRVTSAKRATQGRHAAPPARLADGASRPRSSTGPLLLLALGITAAVVAWGYLVYVAIDFGNAGRNGDATAWWLLGLATVGAIACLFIALMLGARLVGRLRTVVAATSPQRHPGGRRAAR